MSTESDAPGGTGHSAPSTDDDGDLTDVTGVGEGMAGALRDAGYTSLSDAREANKKDLKEIDGIADGIAARLTGEADAGTDPSTEKVGVKVYAPRYQKDIWEEGAEGMGMSLSEFIRCMVQAGRRGFSLDEEPGDDPTLEDEIVDLLDEFGHVTFPELTAAFNDHDEGDIDDAILELQDTNQLKHNPREGWYEPVDSSGP